MTFILIWILIVAIWGVIKILRGKHANHEQSGNKGLTSFSPGSISEESVFKTQNNFESQLGDRDLPDAITGDEIYRYRNIMLPWYNKLAGQYRYDEVMLQKIRSDWLDQTEGLDDRNTYNYLSLEEDDEGQSADYRQKHISASRKVLAIEDAFAAAIGNEAIHELARVRSLDYRLFDRFGNLRTPTNHEPDIS